MVDVGKNTLTGDREVDKALASVEPKLQRRGVVKATRAGAKIVANRAKAYAPVSTGELERSIKVRALRRSRRGTQGHGISAGSKFRDAILPFYAIFIEFGTKLRRHKSGKSVGQVEEDSFLRTAGFESEQAVKREAISVLKKWLRTIK